MPIAADVIHVLLGREPASREDAIGMIGEFMVARGDVTRRYVEGMWEKEARHGTWLTEGVALPHGTGEVKGEIRRSSLVVLQMPKGVDWGGKTVYLAFGVAGRGDNEHLRLLSSLAAVLVSKELVERMIHATDPQEVMAILSGEGGA